MALQIGYDNEKTWYIDFTGKTNLSKAEVRQLFYDFGRVKIFEMTYI
jgi:hypothetical protein